MDKTLSKIWGKILRGSDAGIARKAGVLGLSLGLTMLALCIMVLLAIQSYRKADSHYLILNKKITITNSLLTGKSGFSKEEIESLKDKTFVKDVGEFTSAKFGVVLNAGGDIDFSTELFFEAVPNRFLEELPRRWIWREGENVVPMIISKDFLNLFNFAYAPSRGLPPITESMIGMVPLEVVCRGNGKAVKFQAVVCGFSSRIPGILVPENFLQWANETLSSNSKQDASRLILHFNPSEKEMLSEYILENGYQISGTQILYNKTYNMLLFTVAGLTFLGFLLFILGLSSYFSGIRITILEATPNILLLNLLGKRRKEIADYLFSGSVKILILAAMLPALFCYHIAYWLIQTNLGFLFSGYFSFEYLMGLFLIIFVSAVSFFGLRHYLASGILK